MTVVKLHFIHRRQADLWHRLKWIKLVHRNMQEIKKNIMNKISHTCKSRLNKSPIQLKARALSFCVSVNPLVWSTSDCNIEWLYLVARRYLFGCERIRWANQNADISFIYKKLYKRGVAYAMRGPNSPDHWFSPDTRLRFVYPGDQVIVLDLSIFFKQINQPLNGEVRNVFACTEETKHGKWTEARSAVVSDINFKRRIPISV